MSIAPRDPSSVEPAELDDPRASLAEGLSRYLTPAQIDRLLDEALALEKRVNVTCHACRKRMEVSVPDAKAVVDSVASLLVQGFGRPSEQRADRELTVIRTVEYVCEHGHLCPECEPEPVQTIRSGGAA